MSTGTVIETDVASRLDRLPWTRWHWLIVFGLGVTWILDGLEVTLVGALGGVLKSPSGLGLNDFLLDLSASVYLAGNVVGAIIFGFLTDRWGRKRLFFITLALYLTASALSGLAWNPWVYFLFRFFTGAGIGGEYSAINSAIDELIPARVRGQVDLGINSTFWLGSVLGSGGAALLLGSKLLPDWLAWRVAFLIGAIIGLGILYIRHWIPESPRWLATHGRNDEAEKIVSDVEKTVFSETTQRPTSEIKKAKLKVRDHTPFSEIWSVVSGKYRARAVLALILMVVQAFFFNSIFFTFGQVLQVYHKVDPKALGYYLIPLSLGNAFGPLLLGRLFDRIGRKPMITATYALAGIFLTIAGYLFYTGWFTAATQTVAWTIIFFIASCAASAAYLTVSEIFPLEMRGLAIAFFYAAGTLLGGITGPIVFGSLMQASESAGGNRLLPFFGYILTGSLMIVGGAAELFLGVASEQKSLEDVSTPLSAAE
jgi:MFS family permease